MQQIELIGQPSATYDQLKKSLLNYLESSKINCILNEHQGSDHGFSYDLSQSSVIEFLGHTLIFQSDTDIASKLSKLYLLLESSLSPDQEEKKKCINCDHCRCQKSLNTIS